MTPRQQLCELFEDLARRHVDILHVPGSNDQRRFFYEIAFDTIVAAGGLNNTGWNLVLEGYEGRADDNRNDHEPLLINVGFNVLRHCDPHHHDRLITWYHEAWRIGWEIANNLTAIAENKQNAVALGWMSPGLTAPEHVVRRSISFMEVGPRFDHFYGYRFTLDVRQSCGISNDRDDTKWTEI